MDIKGVIFILLVVVLVSAILLSIAGLLGGSIMSIVGAGEDSSQSDDDDWEDDQWEGAADAPARATKIYGSVSEKGGKAEANGYGVIVASEYTDLTTNGNFTLEDVKVKKTLSINGNSRCHRVHADTIEVSGGAFINDSDAKRLVVKNTLIPGQKPSVTIAGSRIGEIQLSDKGAKESDMVSIKAEAAKRKQA